MHTTNDPSTNHLHARHTTCMHNATTLPLKQRSGGSILKLHEDVQTCGYKDVQVMFEILRSELEDSSTPKQRKPPAWRPPSAWSSRSSSIAAAQ
ncbi:hypothetical protein ABZP36_007059 [Zizania latifolia]